MDRIRLASLGLCLISAAYIDGPVGTTVTPECWEDEVIVEVVDAPNHPELLGTLGCVPGDDLPVHGYRP